MMLCIQKGFIHMYTIMGNIQKYKIYSKILNQKLNYP